ncbi:MAG: ABC transporter ATP-binding protein [Syntrophomonadaceae bacterium]|nr:ABC transporter ATP-binding protein [Syntrophomonadaceae bacterium]
MDIEQGELCAFLGPNGAGKTTAMRMLTGILIPTSGQADVLGYDLLKQSDDIKAHIGYMSQKFSLYSELTVLENLSFYAGLYGINGHSLNQRLQEMLELAELVHRQNDKVATLSRGFRQRLALSCALISRPALLFLDEPTSGVSPSSRRAFFEIIRQKASEGVTVIVSTHFMDEAGRCDRIAFFNQGRLLALDSPDYLRNNVLEGHMVELELPEPVSQLERLKALPYVKECSLHGLMLHVLVREVNDQTALEQYTGVQAQPIIPSLEDVFIALAKTRESR